MGRGRLRRGFSLEVIFEEDTDFCSYLDSLDSVRILAEEKEVDELSVDSLLEDNFFPNFSPSGHICPHAPSSDSQYSSFDYSLHMADMETSFVQWDEFGSSGSGKEGGDKAQWTHDLAAQLGGGGGGAAGGGATHEIDNGRRSRVSRREILESARFLTHPHPGGEEYENAEEEEEEETEGRRGGGVDRSAEEERLKRVSSIFLDTTTTETRTEDEDGESWSDKLASPPSSSPSPSTATPLLQHSPTFSPNFHQTSIHNSDLTDTHTYAIADAHDDVHSIASSTQDYSESSGSVTGNCSEKPLGSEEGGGGGGRGVLDLLHKEGDVRRVREMFERTTTFSSHRSAGGGGGKFMGKSCWDDDPIPPNLPPRNHAPNTRSSSSFLPPQQSSSNRTGERNNKSSEGLLDGGQKAPPAGGKGAGGGEVKVPPKLLSAHSHSSFQLNHLQSFDYDYQDLLVNDKVVIEDSPDIFQTLRSSRIREDAKHHRDVMSGHPFFSSLRTLRRTKSMGTGIFERDYEEREEEEGGGGGEGAPPRAHPTNNRTCILAEEMPAPNIVKNVRNVFERLSSSRSGDGGQKIMMVTTSKGGHFAMSSLGPVCPTTMRASVRVEAGKGGGSGGGSHGGKQSISLLSSIKSNPTSKILRSESFRDDVKIPHFLSHQQSTGASKPSSKIHPKVKAAGPSSGPANSHGEEHLKKAQANFKSEARPEAPPLYEQSIQRMMHTPPDSPPSDLDQLSLVSVSSIGEEEDPKFIPPHVLSRIRSCGTTTTYFGGQIVAKTIENRTLRVNASPLTFSPPPTPTPQQLHHLPLLSPPIAFDTPSSPDLTLPSAQPLGPNKSPGGPNTIIPRIVSVVAKCGGSKGNSPNGSIIQDEGRNSPEGCESEEMSVLEWSPPVAASPPNPEMTRGGDSNNNHVDPTPTLPHPHSVHILGSNKAQSDGALDGGTESNKKFSEISEGAWF